MRDGNGVDLVHISDEIRVNSVDCLLTSELTIVSLSVCGRNNVTFLVSHY